MIGASRWLGRPGDCQERGCKRGIDLVITAGNIITYLCRGHGQRLIEELMRAVAELPPPEDEGNEP